MVDEGLVVFFVGPKFLEHAKLLTLIFFILNKTVLILLQCLKKGKIVSFYYVYFEE